MEEKRFVIRKGIRDNSPRQLILNEEFISFSGRQNDVITFAKNEIAEYSFGIKLMEYDIAFGREYIIALRNYKKQVLKINFKTYFGRKKKEYNKLYSEILSAIWNLYFDDLVGEFILKLDNGESITIGEVDIDQSGIYINPSSSFTKKRVKIPWENVRTSDYATYFAIYDSSSAMEINRGYKYLDDWNTPVLYSVVRTILKRKNIEDKG